MVLRELPVQPEKPGSANVIYSPWIDVTFNAVDTFFEAAIDAPKIVDSIIEKGEVKVYWNINTSSRACNCGLTVFR